jgi:hypothetical protein
VLGYIGTGWWEGNEHPEIRALIMEASGQPPSQRIDAAFDLAYAARTHNHRQPSEINVRSDKDE